MCVALTDAYKGSPTTKIMAATSTAQPSSGSNASRVIFCDHCGSIMDEPSYVGASVACRLCGTTVDASVFQALVLHSAGASVSRARVG